MDSDKKENLVLNVMEGNIKESDKIIDKIIKESYKKLLSGDILIETDNNGHIFFKVKTKKGIENFDLEFWEIPDDDFNRISKGTNSFSRGGHCTMKPLEFLEVYSYEEIANIIAIVIEYMSDVYVYNDYINMILE
jgi:hypothetical protein